MIGDSKLKEIQEQFEDIIIYSQDYPFDIDASNLLNQWREAKSDFPFNMIFEEDSTILCSKKPVQIHLSEKDRKERFDEFMLTLKDNNIFSGDDFENFLQENREGFYDNRVVKGRPRIKQGSKLLRSFKHFVPEDDLRWVQDMASRVIQQDKITGYLYLSIDPRDFLTLSENGENWSSCHSLDGDFRAGNLNYMVDKTTLIAYIADEEKKHFRCLPKGQTWYSKKWRMLIHINEEGMIYYDRQYPFSHDQLLHLVDQTMVDKFDIQENGYCKDPSDFFNNYYVNAYKGVHQFGIRKLTTPQDPYALNENHIEFYGEIRPARDVIDVEDFFGYPDLIKSAVYAPTMRIPLIPTTVGREWTDNKKIFEKYFALKIGAPTLCPCCGKYHIQFGYSLLCDDCICQYDVDEDFYRACQCCGHRIYDNEQYVETEYGVKCMKCVRDEAKIEEGIQIETTLEELQEQLRRFREVH